MCIIKTILRSCGVLDNNMCVKFKCSLVMGLVKGLSVNNPATFQTC